MIRPGFQPESFRQRQAGTLPALLGIEVDSLAEGTISASMQVRGDHMAPNGFLHAASVIALADTTAGYGCMAHLPEGASGFTTIELKANFLGTATSGRLAVDASLVHGGRTTQVGRSRRGRQDHRAVSLHADGFVAQGLSRSKRIDGFVQRVCVVPLGQ